MNGDADYVKVMFGENARHAPCWMYVQDAGEGVVSFVGASRVPVEQCLAGVHPLRYGSTRTHQLVVGELIVRPQLVIATDALIGRGLADLVQGDHDMDAMLANGEYVVDATRGVR